MSDHNHTRRDEIFLQPIDDFIVCKGEYKLIDNAIIANCPANKFQGGVLGVAEYEMVSVEGR